MDTAWDIWPIVLSVPVDTSKPPDSEEILARAGTLSEVGIRLLKLAPQLPEQFMRKVVDVSRTLIAASNEQIALGVAVAEATVDAEGNQVTWDEARRSHEEGSSRDHGMTCSWAGPFWQRKPSGMIFSES